jgi:Spy/CpxP family protein refolding chaperone
VNKTLGVAVILAAVVIPVLFSQALLANGASLGPQGMVWRLDLSKAQKENISNKENSVEKEILQLQQSIRDQRKELDALLSADKPDNSKINKQKKQIFFMLWMRQQLTPDQKQKLLALIKSRQAKEGSGEAR